MNDDRRRVITPSADGKRRNRTRRRGSLLAVSKTNK